MKILFYCLSFYPKTGGLETVAQILAEGLCQKEHEVYIITTTDLNGVQELETDYTLLRKPSILEFWSVYRKCDVFIHHNVSLKGIWPLLFFPKRWIVIHHLTYYDRNGNLKPLEWLKRILSKFTYNISCSHFVNDSLPKKGEVVWNPYHDKLFVNYKLERKKNSFLFVGRLVSDKGVDLLIDAFAKVKQKNPDVVLTIIGDGPERHQLSYKVSKYQLEKSVTFKGTLKGKELVEEMNQYQWLVIPSVWKEPFGVVALEGIACGCIPIYSRTGGLPEACGNLGVPFEANDKDDLAQKMLESLMSYSNNHQAFLQSTEKHLQKYTQNQVIDYYHKLIESCLN